MRVLDLDVANHRFDLEKMLSSTGDRGFESTSLQRRDGMGQAAKEMAPSSL